MVSLRRFACALIAGSVVLFAASTNSPAATEIPALPLKGGGAWGAYREILAWQDALSGSKSPIDLRYTPHGTFIGRQDFIAGTNDFVLTGVPFAPDELAKIPGGAAGVIGAPVQVSSLGFLLQAPVPDGFATIDITCNPADPPPECIVKRPYTGPIRVPSENLAAMALHHTGTTFPPLNSWNNPDVLQAMGVSNFTTPPLAGPGPVNRSEPDEVNYFLQQYAATKAPGVWNGLKAVDPLIKWEPIGERLGRQSGASRDGVDQQAQQLGLGGGDPTTGTITQFTAGVFAPVPPSAKEGVKQSFPNAQLQFIQVQNANGEWVEPTPDSINAAVDAGGASPLYAMTNKVPGAYPLVWVDQLYAPAKGLSIDKTEAIAAVIRYLAVAGQAAAKPVGEGRLSAALVKQALTQADALVSSNCVGKDRRVETSTDPGPYAPALPALAAIGPMAHCVSGTPAPGAANTSFTGGSFSSPGFLSGSSGGSSSASTATDAPASGGAGAIKVRRTASGALVATQLPLPEPSATGGADRFAALLLGAGLFLLLRKPIRRFLAKGGR